jgi:hypothetical protein
MLPSGCTRQVNGCNAQLCPPVLHLSAASLPRVRSHREEGGRGEGGVVHLIPGGGGGMHGTRAPCLPRYDTAVPRLGRDSLRARDVPRQRGVRRYRDMARRRNGPEKSSNNGRVRGGKEATARGRAETGRGRGVQQKRGHAAVEEPRGQRKPTRGTANASQAPRNPCIPLQVLCGGAHREGGHAAVEELRVHHAGVHAVGERAPEPAGAPRRRRRAGQRRRRGGESDQRADPSLSSRQSQPVSFPPPAPARLFPPASAPTRLYSTIRR